MYRTVVLLFTETYVTVAPTCMVGATVIVLSAGGKYAIG